MRHTSSKMPTRLSSPLEPHVVGALYRLVRLAASVGHCTTGDVDPLASAGVPPVLAVEVRPGRPPIPADLQALIRRMALENPTWGQERIANELLLKLGLRVSPRTVRKYMPRRLDRGRADACRPNAGGPLSGIMPRRLSPVTSASWSLRPFVFSTSLSSLNTPRRRLLHVNVTAHPTAEWTLQQLREAIPSDHRYRFLIHDRDAFSHGSGPGDSPSGAAGAEDATAEVPRPMPSANGCLGPYGGSAWTS